MNVQRPSGGIPYEVLEQCEDKSSHLASLLLICATADLQQNLSEVDSPESIPAVFGVLCEYF